MKEQRKKSWAPHSKQNPSPVCCMHCAVKQWSPQDIALSTACRLLFLLIHPRSIPTILLHLFLSATYNLTFSFSFSLPLSLSNCPQLHHVVVQALHCHKDPGAGRKEPQAGEGKDRQVLHPWRPRRVGRACQKGSLSQHLEARPAHDGIRVGDYGHSIYLLSGVVHRHQEQRRLRQGKGIVWYYGWYLGCCRWGHERITGIG